MPQTTQSSRIALVGEAQGEWEAVGQHPFVGVSGPCLFDLLCDAGLCTRTPQDASDLRDFWHFFHIWQSTGKPGERLTSAIEPRPMIRLWSRRDFILTNVFNLHPPNNDIETLCVPKSQAPSGLPMLRAGKYISQDYIGELVRLHNDLTEATLIICLGGTATWAILRNPLISKIRGTVARAHNLNCKVISCYHPAAVLRQWELRAVTILDLMKAKRESTFPEIRRPQRKIYIPETLEDLYSIMQVTPLDYIAPDIETIGDQISCVGFAITDDRAVTIPFIDPRRGGSYWATQAEEEVAWKVVAHFLGAPVPKVFQNCLFDIRFLWEGYGIPIAGEIEDTMLLHHSLQPEQPKGLDYLGSIYTDEPAWKLMNRHSKTIKQED